MKLPLKLALLAVIFVPAVVRATPYKVEIQATVGYIYGTAWDSSVSIDTQMNAVFFLDTDTPASMFLAHARGYAHDGLTASITVGNYHYTADTQNWLVIYDNDPMFGEGYQLDAFAAAISIAPFYSFISARLWSSDFSLLSNMDQPVQEFNIDQITNPYLTVGGFTSAAGTSADRQEISGRIISYQVTSIPSVPEHTSVWAAFGSMMIFVAALRRKLPL